jgi:hypothetical protein
MTSDVFAPFLQHLHRRWQVSAALGEKEDGCEKEVAANPVLAGNSAMENLLFRTEADAGKSA